GSRNRRAERQMRCLVIIKGPAFAPVATRTLSRRSATARRRTAEGSFGSASLTERYRSGRNGGASKASCPVRGTLARIPPSPNPSLSLGLRLGRESRASRDSPSARRDLARIPPSPNPSLSLGLRLGRESRASRDASTQLLGRRDLEAGEIPFGAWSNPKRHPARGIAEFEIIHNQTGLVGAVDIQTRLRSFDGDAVTSPGARLEVHVALIFFRCLLTGDREAKIRVCAV